MKNTVQNSIFRNWIRKKWIFVRFKIHFFAFLTVYGRKGFMEDHARGSVEGPPMLLVQPGLRIYCADRTKTYREEASGPSRSDWNGRMPLLFCRRLNSNVPVPEKRRESNEWFALYPGLCYTEQQTWIKT